MDSPLGRVELCNVAATDNAQSEDLVKTAGSAAWLLDGAGAHDDPQACKRHDASWFVQQLSHALAAELGEAPARHLHATLAGAIARVDSLHERLCPHVLQGHGPAATAVIVRRRSQTLDYLVLGDSALLVQTGDGQVHHHSDKRLSTVDPRLRESIHLALRSGCGYDSTGHHERIRRLRATERSMRNRQGGFWIAADDPRAALHSLAGSYTLTGRTDGASRIALISDGLARAVTHLQCYSGWRELLEDLFGSGIAACVTRVRDAERADPDGSRHPRSKPADDAAAITCALAP